MTYTTVKFFTSAMNSAPTLPYTAGSLIAILDACLVNGFGSVTASSAVISNGVCTLTFGSTHSFLQSTVALVSGITSSGYTSLNAEQKVTSITSTSISFATTLADATLTGTISAKLAPAGWTKAFSGTNLAAYKSSSIAATGFYLRVDDTTTYYAGVRGYESMTDVSTGTNAFPTTSQQSTLIWQKYSATSGNAQWAIYADDQMVYFWVASIYGNATQGIVYCFGDFLPKKSGDAYRCVLAADTTTNMSGETTYQPIATQAPFYGYSYAPRSYAAIGSPVSMTRTWLGGNSISGTSGWVFPNGPDNGIYPTQIFLLENSHVRGQFPGVYASPQATGQSIADQYVFSNVSSLSRDLVYRWTNVGNAGGVYFDLTGPWEH